MNKFLFFVFIVSFSGCMKKHLSVYWTGGEVAIGIEYEYTHEVGWLTYRELGLRSDGVVMWREKKIAPK